MARIPVMNKIFIKLTIVQFSIILLSNWLVRYKFNIAGSDAILFSVFTYPLALVATDLTIRFSGATVARIVVLLSFIPAIFASMFLTMLAGEDIVTAFRLGAGSGIAYLVGSFVNIELFRIFRKISKITWLAPSAAGLVATIVDTLTFCFVAFSGGNTDWLHMADGYILWKLIISVLIVLPIYSLMVKFFLRDQGYTKWTTSSGSIR